MSFATSALMVVLGLVLVCHQAVSLRQHVSGRSFAGQKIDLDLQMEGDVLEIDFKKPANAPGNFRETTSRYFFKKQLVAHKDKQASRCYLQRTTLTREDVERRLNNANQSIVKNLEVEEEWINTARAIPINHQMLMSDMFGPEVTEFCRFEQVFYLGEGSYGAHVLSAPTTGLRRPGLRTRRAPGDTTVVIIATEDVVIIVVIREL